MREFQLTNTFLDQTNDLYWIVSNDFKLIDANKAYLCFMKEATGEEKKLNDSAFVTVFGKADVNKWKSYYTKALRGESFEIESHFYNEKSKETEYNQVTFQPLRGDDSEIFAVACHSRDITRLVKHKSEANQLMDSSLDVFCTVNDEGLFVYVSAAAKDHWGYTPEELIGRSWRELILQEDLDKTNEQVSEIVGGREVKAFANRYKRKDGGVAYNLWSARYDPHTKLRYAVARDGKEKIEQEAQILQSEQRFKALVQEGHDLYAIIDREGTYTYMSPSSTTVVGIPPEAFIGKNAFDYLHPDDIQKTLASLKKVINEDRVVVEPYRAKNQNNEWRWVESVLTNMLDNPAVKGIVVNSRDITDEVREKQRLKLLESVITNTKDAVLITEADPINKPGPKILYVNGAFTKMTGYEAEEVIGKTPRILQGPNSDKKELAKLGRALRDWEPYEMTSINYKKTGEEFWINFAVTPVTDETGRPTHWIAIERDVTEQKNKELENELLAQISSIFNTEVHLTTATAALCEVISKFGCFDWVEIWTSNFQYNRMQLLSHYVANQDDEIFYDYNPELNEVEVAEGLAGKVWGKKAQLLWGKAEIEKGFLRKAAASKIGLKSMLGMPLVIGGEVIGVLKIGIKRDTRYLEKYTRIFQTLEGFLGSVLNRKKLENDLSYLINAIPDIICVLDFEGKFLKMNKSGCNLFGCSEEKLLNQSFDKFVHSAEKNTFENHLKNANEADATFKFESRHTTNKGESVWLSWYCNPLYRDGLVYATAKDITEEKELRDLIRQVGELVKIGIWEVDMLTNSTYWSDEVHRIHGTDPDSFEPNLESAIHFYREDFREMVREKVEKCIAQKEAYDFEAIIVTAEKKEVWVRANGNAEYTDDVCTRIYGSFQDISDRKESEDKLESFANNLPGVAYQYTIHPDGNDTISYVSKGVKEVWGLTAEEVVGGMDLAWDRIEAGGDMELVEKSIARSIENRTQWTCRYKYVMPSGEHRTHVGYGMPSFLTDGTIRFNSIVLDITQEANNERLLEEITKIARIGSWEMDLVNQDGDHMYWSPMLFEITEVDDDYIPTLSGGIELHVGESQKRIQRALEALISDGIEFDEEILLRTAKGRERWSRALGKSETINGKRVKIFGSYQDIHERKLAELELTKNLKSLEDYKYSLDQSAIIAFTDKHGVITSANENFCKISGYSKEELIGNTHRLINADHHPASFFVDLWKTITSGKVWRGEIKNKAKNGSHYWVDTTIVPFLDEKNRPTQFLAIRFDITERKTAEQERNSLQATIENSLNEIYTFNAETLIFTYANKGALLNLGYSLQELKVFTPIDIKPHYTLASFKELVAPLLSNEKGKITFFTDHKRKDGSLYPVEVHLQLVREGNSKRFLAVVLDITERKEADNFLLQANERFEKVTEATNDAIWDWDIVEQRFYRSKAIERFFGGKTAQLFTEDDFWKDSFHPKDLPSMQKSLEEALADPSRNRWTQEYRLFNEEGETLHVIDRGVIVRDDQGKAIRMVGAMTDVTQQRKSEEENRFKARLLNMIGQSAIATDLAGVVNYWNKAAEKIYGWTAEEALGKDAAMLTPSDVNKEQVAEILHQLKNGRSWTGEFEVKRKDGTRFPVRVSNSPIYDENDVISGMIGISSDITQEVHNEELLKQYTRDLERSNEELEQFAFVASHDLQEPLRMISSFMNLLERKYEDRLDEKALQYIHFATDGAKRMKQIILDLLEYSRANRPTEGKENVDMNEVISEFKLLRRKLISEKSASLQTDNLPTLHTYKASVTQVIHCLLDNALKYSEEDVPPKIEISARANKDEWVFSVKDNGIGIDPQFFEKIFIIFQRLHNNDRYEGTGIGLSIAKRHIEFLGGQITVNSKVGKGSTFYFSIPK